MSISTRIEQMIRCPILCYHHFVEREIGDMSVATTADKFEKDLTGLLEDGYTPISLRQRRDCELGMASWPDKPFICTMDDGYESNYLLAYPILMKLGVHSDIFIVTDTVGARPEGGVVGTAHFTWDQAREMEASGLVTMQAHGKMHVNNDELSISEFDENAFGCIRAIEEHMGRRDFIAYAYPCGHYEEEKFSYLSEKGVHCQMMAFWRIQPSYISHGAIARTGVDYKSDLSALIDEYRATLTQWVETSNEVKG